MRDELLKLLEEVDSMALKLRALVADSGFIEINPVIDTVFDCAASIASFNFNNGVTTGLQAGQALPLSVDYIGTDGNRIASNFITLSVTVNGAASNAISFSSSAPPDPTNNYNFTVPSIDGPVDLVFTWGSTLDPSPCTHSISVDVEYDGVGGGGIITEAWTGGDHPNFQPLIRQFPGYGGAALNDAAVNSVYFMTNLNASGAGSMAGAPSNAYVVPMVAGKIVSSNRITLSQGNIRFLGQLAPGHLSINGTTAFNSSDQVRFAGSNVLYEHFSIRCGDNPATATTGSHAPFAIWNGVNGSLSGVVLSNMSVHYGSDDSGSIFYDSNAVTLNRLLVGHGVTMAAAGGKHDNGLFIGGGCSDVTLFQTLMMTSGRSPLIQEVTKCQAVNSLVYHTAQQSGTSQIYGVNTGGRPGLTQNVNFHDNLDIRFNGTNTNIWTGQGGSSTLELYANNNKSRNCAGVFQDMGYTSGVSNVGNRNASKHFMPSLPAITDLTLLESHMLPKAGNYLTRDSLDDDVINIINNCSTPAVEKTASDYFANPWPVGPTKPTLTFWDASSPDGLSDDIKVACGIAAGTNTLSPNDGRWEAIVDFGSGGLLSASIS